MVKIECLRRNAIAIVALIVSVVSLVIQIPSAWLSFIGLNYEVELSHVEILIDEIPISEISYSAISLSGSFHIVNSGGRSATLRMISCSIESVGLPSERVMTEDCRAPGFDRSNGVLSLGPGEALSIKFNASVYAHDKVRDILEAARTIYPSMTQKEFVAYLYSAYGYDFIGNDYEENGVSEFEDYSFSNGLVDPDEVGSTGMLSAGPARVRMSDLNNLSEATYLFQVHVWTAVSDEFLDFPSIYWLGGPLRF